MGLPIAKVFVLCVIGNMAPILPLLLALRSPLVQKILDKPLSKARSKSDAVSGNARWSALAAFVGVPFPGTGAWTGAMVAFVLGMPLSEALSAIFAGVLVAGAIMSLRRRGDQARAVAPSSPAPSPSRPPPAATTRRRDRAGGSDWARTRLTVERDSNQYPASASLAGFFPPGQQQCASAPRRGLVARLPAAAELEAAAARA
ncbi:small multi-drug export protein [Aureococcus anophagefferens]|nr:small multi-drug export protein [Aureococcus anophagefferens]